MSTFTVIVALLVLIVVVAVLFGKKIQPDQQAPHAHGGAQNMTPNPENEAEYQLGLHPGEDGQALMYTLSSCRHCVNVKNWLNEEKIPFHEVYVDKFFGNQRMALMNKLCSYNPRGSFPTLVLPGGKRCVVGFRVIQLRKEFGRDTSMPTV